VGRLEYRFIRPDQVGGDGWMPATADGEQVKAELRSPPVPFGTGATPYQLVIEARDPQTGVVERYPYTFWLGVVEDRK
jgi:hypothetical protein